MIIDILGEEIDKKGSTLIIKHSSTLAYSPAYSFFLRQVAELIDNKHGAPAMIWSDDQCGIIWAESDGIIYGIFAYTKEAVERFKILSITLTAVDRQYRERGVHTILNKYFEETAKNLGCFITEATVNPNNTVRLATAKKDGLTIKYKNMFKKVL